MDLIERYTYAVTKRLPSNQREDVEKELKGLIADMLAERSGEGESSKTEVEAVLLNLGDPSRLADRYRGAKRYLIGPENFDTYLLLLKVVVAAVAFGLTVALTVGYVVDPPQHLLQALGNYFTTIFSAVAGVFAWLTIIFAVLEYNGVKTFDFTKEKDWRPADLPQVPVKTSRIRPLDPIVAIIFTVLLIVMFNAANQFIGIFSFGEDSTVTAVPLLNPEVFRLYLPYFNVLLVLAIVKECLKLIAGKWTLALAGFNGALNIASLLLVITAFSNFGIWNEGFFQYIIQSGILPADTDLGTIWSTSTKVFMALFAFGMIVDTVVSLAKALKHKVAAYL